MAVTLAGKTLSQWCYSDKARKQFLTQWLSNIEFGLGERQFCESLAAHGDDNSQAIANAVLKEHKSLCQALRGWFPDLLLSGIEVASASGDTAKGIQAAIKQLEGGQRIMGIIARLFAMPFALTIGLSALGLHVSSKILSATPEPSELGLTINHAFSQYGVVSACLLVGVFMAMGMALPRLTGKSRAMMDSLPVFSLYKHAVLSDLLLTLSNLISCGMKLDGALAALEAKSTPFLHAHIKQMRAQRIGQVNLGRVLDTGLFIPLALAPLKVLGEHADYQSLLAQSAHLHSESVNTRIALMKAIFPKVGITLAITCLAMLIGSSLSGLFALM